MKGVVIVELLEMAEAVYGEALVDEAVSGCALSSGGAFSRVGYYPCSDLVALVERFSALGGEAPDALQRRFGHWMLKRFSVTHPVFFADKPDGFALLEALEDEIHVEVRKLYPDAELPRFETARLAPNRLRMIYRSPRPLGAFCHGLIEACLIHFGETPSVTQSAHAEDPSALIFDIERPK